GLLTPSPASIESSDKALRVAGRADLEATAVELIGRSGAARDETLVLTVAAARARATRDDALNHLITRHEAPRPSLAGLSLDRPRLMGIVNVTPDSFSDGGTFSSAQEAIDHALRLENEGA